MDGRSFVPAHVLADTITRSGHRRVRKSHNLTPLEVAALAALVRYPILNAEQIGVLIGTSYRFACAIVKTLKSESNRYIELCEAQKDDSPPYMHPPRYYRLGPAGVKEAIAREFDDPKWPEVHNLLHKAMEQNILLSFELGQRAHPEVKISGLNEILKHELAPKALRKAPYPQSIPLTRKRPNGRAAHYRMDGSFVLIEAKRRFFFPGIEAETGHNQAKTVEETKYRDILDILKNKINLEYLGARNVYFPFYLPHLTRVADLMTRWTRVTQAYPQYRPHLLFAVEPTLNSKLDNQPKIDGHALEQSYLCVGENGQVRQLSLLD
jgi:hypothetical protein